jgi:hypothetical protein
VQVVKRFAHNPTIHRNAAGRYAPIHATVYAPIHGVFEFAPDVFRYLLFHIGCGATEEPCATCKHCTNGTTPHSRYAPPPPPAAAAAASSGVGVGGSSKCNGPHWTGLRSSLSLDGPWEDEGTVVLDTNKSNTWITNPCVVVPHGGAANATTYVRPLSLRLRVLLARREEMQGAVDTVLQQCSRC